jgi:microcystin-dependent protein
MSSPFVAEIRMFAFNFAPVGWATCNGQILPISQNTALFSLIGTFYGGNGTSNFALPNLQGTVPIHAGQGSGLTQRSIGEQGGSTIITLLQGEMPAHSHFLNADTSDGTTSSPSANVIANGNWNDGTGNTGGLQTYTTTAQNVLTLFGDLTPVGGSQPHSNVQPYLTVNFCIALQGIFPPRS